MSRDTIPINDPLEVIASKRDQLEYEIQQVYELLKKRELMDPEEKEFRHGPLE